MKGDILKSALEILKETAIIQKDFIEALQKTPYGGSTSVGYNYEIVSRKNSIKRGEKQARNEKIRRMRTFISKMKKDGLVVENSDNMIKISKKGRDKLEKLNKRMPDKQ